MNPYTRQIGASTVSSGTLKREDLIPAFLDAFDGVKYEGMPAGVDPMEWQRFIGQAEVLIGDIEERMGESDDYWSSEAIWDLDTLFVLLEEAAAFQGRTFGAHPGDGALFGFWEGE